MKDPAHHMSKLNKKVVRSENKQKKTRAEDEEIQQYMQEYRIIPSKKEVRKIKKEKMKKETLNKTPSPLTPEERNHEMRLGRVPITRPRSHEVIGQETPHLPTRETPQVPPIRSNKK